jgi:hypothetical protein
MQQYFTGKHDQGHLEEERYTETPLSEDKQHGLAACYLPKQQPLSKSLPTALRAFIPDSVGSRFLWCVRLTFYQTTRGQPTQDGSLLREIYSRAEEATDLSFTVQHVGDYRLPNPIIRQTYSCSDLTDVSPYTLPTQWPQHDAATFLTYSLHAAESFLRS